MLQENDILIFDFDGVLSIPYTHPEEYYPQIPDLIKELSKNYVLCVASFNPRASLVIKKWGLHSYFSVTREGSNFKWSEEYNEEYRKGLSKSQQIKDIMKNLFHTEEKQYNHNIYFFDDDQDNINEVKEKLSHVKTVFVDNKHGLGL